MTEPDFPVLDSDRAHANKEYARVVLDFLGYIEPYVEEVDSWVSMPVRLAHDQAGGLRLEIGPYTLAAADTLRIRDAIRSYDTCVNGPSIRRIQ